MQKLGIVEKELGDKHFRRCVRFLQEYAVSRKTSALSVDFALLAFGGQTWAGSCLKNLLPLKLSRRFCSEGLRYNDLHGREGEDHRFSNNLEEFRQGKEKVAEREKELADYLVSAEEMYTGQQHVRLMRGIEAIGRDKVDLNILSAGYGFLLPIK